MMFPDRLLDHAGPGRPCATATVRMAFRHRDVVGARDEKTFAAQWLAYASPCRRFAADLAIDCARLGAGVVRTTFTVEDFHLILLAGLPAHPCFLPVRGAGPPPTRPAIKRWRGSFSFLVSSWQGTRPSPKARSSRLPRAPFQRQIAATNSNGGSAWISASPTKFVRSSPPYALWCATRSCRSKKSTRRR